MIGEAEARDALKAMGISTPSPGLIEAWIRRARAEEDARQQQEARMPQAPSAAPPTSASPQLDPAPQSETQGFRPKHPRGSSRSNLEPALRKQGTLERPRGVRRVGRPRV